MANNINNQSFKGNFNLNLMYSPAPVKTNITPPTSPFGTQSKFNKNDHSPTISPFKYPNAFKSPSVRINKRFFQNEEIESDNAAYKQYSPKFANSWNDLFSEIKQFNEEQIQNENNNYEKESTENNEKNIASLNKKTRYCNCKRSKCLKLYCECFAIGETCDPNCSCLECLNLRENIIRKDTIDQILMKDPTAFNSKFENLSATKKINRRGCTCRKTNCLKKYCECFHAGIVCSELCKCDECKNTEFDFKNKHKDRIDIEYSNKKTPLKNYQDEESTEETDNIFLTKKITTPFSLNRNKKNKDSPIYVSARKSQVSSFSKSISKRKNGNGKKENHNMEIEKKKSGIERSLFF